MLSTVTTATAKISCCILDDLDAVQAIAPEWNTLLTKSGCNLAFSSAQWFVAGCRSTQALRPYVLIARRADILVGVLPLILSARGTLAGFLEDEADYHDMVVAPEDDAVSTGLLRRALSPTSGHQRLVLSRVRRDSNSFRAASMLSSAHYSSCHYRHDTTCPYITLPATYDDYIVTKSKSFQTSLHQAQLQAEKANLRVCALRPEDFPPADLAGVFLSLHLDRFGERSSLATPAMRSFLREILPSLFVEHRVLAFALYEADMIIAMNLCMVGPSSLGLWNGGFSARAERWSPGKLLIGASIREACVLKMAQYDFLRGSEAYKSRWASETRPLIDMEFKF